MKNRTRKVKKMQNKKAEKKAAHLATKIAVSIALCIAIAFPFYNDAKAQSESQSESQALRFDYGNVKLVLNDKKKGALIFQLQKGWKLYWRKNNINSLPTKIKWKNQSSKIIWPVPNSFKLLGMKSYGYEGELALPFINSAQENAGSSAQVNFLVCREVCLPIKKNLIATIASKKDNEKIIKALKLVPRTYSEEDSSSKIQYLPIAAKTQEKSLQKIEENNLEKNNLETLLIGSITLPENQRVQKPRLIIEEDYEDGAIFDVQSIKNNQQTIKFKALGQFKKEAQKYNLRITLLDEKYDESNYPIEWNTTAELAPYKNSFLQNESLQNILKTKPMLWLLIVSLLGGLILNAMPCVFPVLAIKIAYIAKTSSEQNVKNIRKALAANAMGMITAFIILALFVVIVSSSGRKLGWGFQFQSPFFNAVIASMLIILAADGLRIINLPFAPYSEKGAMPKQSLRTDFITGIVITWLATPCAAPIFGSAMSLALAQKPSVIIIMFAAMGLGMASPILLGAAFPAQCAKLLPKPGPWTEIVRKIIGAIILLIAIWLLVIFAKQVSKLAALLLAASIAALVAIVRSKLIYKNKITHKTSNKIIWATLVATPLLLALILTQTLATTKNSKPDDYSQVNDWRAFKPDEIPKLLDENNIVLVDVTADWCITCKVNEKIVYQSDRVRRQMKKMEIVQMRADWTAQDPKIEKFLRQHDRFAIPFTIIFTANEENIILPEIFSPNTFLDALAYAEKLRSIKAQNELKAQINN